jgi:hypothetical protein
MRKETRIELIRSLHANMKEDKSNKRFDGGFFDPENVGEDYFEKAEKSKSQAEKICDDDEEGWEVSAPISKLFDRQEQFEKAMIF